MPRLAPVARDTPNNVNGSSPLSPPGEYWTPPGFVMSVRSEPCGDGHRGWWARRVRGKMTDWLCCFMPDARRMCEFRLTVGGRQGFMATGRSGSAPYTIKSAVLVAIFNHQYTTGGDPATIVDIRMQSPGLSDGQIQGGLDRSVKSRHLEKSGERELAVQGWAMSYALTHRGQSYVLLKYPQTKETIRLLRAG